MPGNPARGAYLVHILLPVQSSPKLHTVEADAEVCAQQTDIVIILQQGDPRNNA